MPRSTEDSRRDVRLTRTQRIAFGCLVAGVLAREASDTPGRVGRPSPGLPDFDVSEVAEGMFPFRTTRTTSRPRVSPSESAGGCPARRAAP